MVFAEDWDGCGSVLNRTMKLATLMKGAFTNCFPVKWIPFDSVLPTVDLLSKVESIVSDPDTVLKN